MKEIQLTQGKVALVDDEDFDWVNQFNWCAQGTKGKRNRQRFYAARRKGSHLILLHRWLLNAEETQEVDHKNHNSLDCQKHNLRVATSQQNSFNTQKSKRTKMSSQYKGVCKVKPIVNALNPFMAYISVNRKRIHLGYFSSEVDAAKTYDLAAIRFFKEFACLNFP